MIKPNNAAKGGTKAMISMAKREPIMVYDLNKKRSPRTNPTIPDKLSHNQLYELASEGKNLPRRMNAKILRNKNPKSSRMIFTASEPTLRLADSKARAVAVQKTAVQSA